MTAQYATADDPSSGGRQMPGHYGVARAQPRVGLVAGRDPAAPRRRDRAGGQDPQDRPGRDDHAWARARRNQGDVHEGLNFAAIHKLPFVFVVENNGYAISVPAAMEVVGRGRRRPRVRLRHPGRRRRRRGRAGLLRGGARRGRAGPRGRRPDAHRGQGHPADRATPRTTSRRSTAPRRSSTAEKGRDALPRFRDAAPRRRRPDRRDRGARSTAEIKAAVDDATEYAEASPTPTRRPRRATSTPRTSGGAG